MSAEFDKLHIVLILTFGFAFASLFGYLCRRVHLSPIVGFLFAGYLIGPFSPGFVADLQLAEQLAAIGVILMLFNVGLQFKWEELFQVKHIALPGAVIQTFAAVVITTLVVWAEGWRVDAGIIMGLAIGVASTVILVRMLSDNNLLHTLEGHIAVGWLVVEDLFTVVVLLLLPLFALFASGNQVSLGLFAQAVVSIFLQVFMLLLLLYLLGRFVLKKVLLAVARTRSAELFTISLLALTLLIASGSAYFFHVSIALGAFLAGMIMGQTEARYQALAQTIPLKDAFVVIFFLSIGMLFNPETIFLYPFLFFGVLLIILLVKPLVAFLVMVLFKQPLKTSLLVGVSLAQIGEFSFILGEEASRFQLLPDAGYDVLVACALLSIAINPFYFDFVQTLFTKSSVSGTESKTKGAKTILTNKALVVGYGPVGEEVAEFLTAYGLTPVIIDSNMDTIQRLQREGVEAIFGDARELEVMKGSSLAKAALLVVTIPNEKEGLATLQLIKEHNPHLPIFARVRYASQVDAFRDLGVRWIVCDEEAVARSLKQQLINYLKT